ncbi:hypothetical protein M5K25_013504 [Dendrobium thyrsiflorum]|uniref:Uncharacterized protein n=1 Tax=Dendrobium thyrsiflorum TaxID=117978 RepID=A0ABD0UU66_DENTH
MATVQPDRAKLLAGFDPAPSQVAGAYVARSWPLVDKEQRPVISDERPSQSEIGSNSSAPFIGKNRKKNYLRRVKKRIIKARKNAESAAFKRVKFEGSKEFVAPCTYPLSGGSHFHPLFVDQMREVVRRIARPSPCPFDYYIEKIDLMSNEQSPAIDHRPPVEGYDPSTLLEDVRIRFASGGERPSWHHPSFEVKASFPLGQDKYSLSLVLDSLVVENAPRGTILVLRYSLSLGLDSLVVENAPRGTILVLRYSLFLGLDLLVVENALRGTILVLRLRIRFASGGERPSWHHPSFEVEDRYSLSLGLDLLVEENALRGTILVLRLRYSLSLGLDLLVVEYALRGTILVLRIRSASGGERPTWHHPSFDVLASFPLGQVFPFLRIRSLMVEYALRGTILVLRLRFSLSLGLDLLVVENALRGTILVLRLGFFSFRIGLDLLVVENALRGTILVLRLSPWVSIRLSDASLREGSFLLLILLISVLGHLWFLEIGWENAYWGKDE